MATLTVRRGDYALLATKPSALSHTLTAPLSRSTTPARLP